VKILHLTNTLLAGGAELHLLTLCRTLKKQGVEVVVAYLKGQGTGSRSLIGDFEEAEIRLVYLNGERRSDLVFVLRLIQLLKSERPDIIHTHLPRADLGGFVAKLLVPETVWVASAHAIYSNSWSGRRLLPLFSHIWNCADAVVAISYAVSNWLLNDRGIRTEKIVVIHYGIEGSHFDLVEANEAIDNSSRTSSVIGSLGRLVETKGHDVLVRAGSAVFAAMPDASIVIGGGDPHGYGKKLQMQIDELQLGKKIHLVGFNKDVPAFLRSLDIFAFATRSEGFGQVLIEAMASGLPVVASQIPPLDEIVIDGKTGLLVEKDNPAAFARAIIELLQNPKTAIQMGRNGRRRVEERFTSIRMSAETISLYHRILGNRRQTGSP